MPATDLEHSVAGADVQLSDDRAQTLVHAAMIAEAGSCGDVTTGDAVLIV